MERTDGGGCCILVRRYGEDDTTAVSDPGADEGARHSGAAAGGEAADVAGGDSPRDEDLEDDGVPGAEDVYSSGYLVQGPDGLYRQVARTKKLRFGYASQSSDMPFSVQVTESLTEAAAQVGVDLLVLDNKYDAQTALENAEEFVRARVDLVIEFQVEQEVAPMIAHKIAEAKIPLIAIDIPHPHATFFGVDNYKVGMAAGEALAEHALEQWDGKVDWTLGLDLPEAGHLVQSRITGAFEGVKKRDSGSAGGVVCADRWARVSG